MLKMNKGAFAFFEWALGFTTDEWNAYIDQCNTTSPESNKVNESLRNLVEEVRVQYKNNEFPEEVTENCPAGEL